MRGASSPSEIPAVSAEVWEEIFKEALLFAEYQVSRCLWRGRKGGVLPEGFDANSIAAQAIMDFLAAGQSVPMPGSAEGVSGSLLYRDLILPNNRSTVLPKHGPSADPALREIKRLILKQVTRLHHLKENFLVSNDADLCLVRSSDGEWKSPVELIPSPGVQPDEALIRKESFLEFEKLKLRFVIFLGKESRLIHLLGLNYDGIHRPQQLAARLKLRRRTVENLQQKLQRRWLRFSQSRQLQHA